MLDRALTILDSEKNKLAQDQPLIWLIEVSIPSDPPTRLRITNYNDPVLYGQNSQGAALTYSPFPALHGEISESSKGDLRDFEVKVSNVTLELMAAIDQYEGLIGQEVVLRIVSAAALNDPNAQIDYVGSISACSVDQEAATFTVGSVNLTKAKFPRNRYVARHCRFRYGGPECGYMIPVSPPPDDTIGGGLSTCARTIEACEDHGADELARGVTVLHPLRYGGFPGTYRGPAST